MSSRFGEAVGDRMVKLSFSSGPLNQRAPFVFDLERRSSSRVRVLEDRGLGLPTIQVLIDRSGRSREGARALEVDQSEET